MTRQDRSESRGGDRTRVSIAIPRLRGTVTFPVMALMALFLAVEPGADAVAHTAHLAGAAAAFVYIKIWRRHRTRRRPIPIMVQEGRRLRSKQPGRNRASAIRVPDEL